MKNLIGLIILICLVLVGCGGGGDSSSHSDSRVSPINRAPVLSIVSNQTSTITYPITQIDPDGADPDGDTLTYSCVYDIEEDGEVEAGSLCSELSGLSFSTTTGIFNWTPVNGEHGGIYEFKITVSDGELSASEIFMINVFTCPENYVLVYGDASMGTDDFCLAKYSMKLDKGAGIVLDGNNPDLGWSADWTAVSAPEGKPWSSISLQEAVTSCQNLSDGNFDYSLVTNDQWQTTARNIENTDSNWSGGLVGSGQINRGHSDFSPNESLAASTDDDPYFGTGNNSGQAYGSGGEQKRTHNLSSSDIVWDLSGNINEFVYFGTTGYASYTVPEPIMTQELASAIMMEIYGTGNIEANDFLPSNINFNSLQNMGANGGSNQGTFTNMIISRGLGFSGNELVGIFGTRMDWPEGSNGNSISFRCTSTLADVGY